MDLISIRCASCLGGVMRVKVRGSKVRGDRKHLPKGPWRLSPTSFDPFTCAQAHTLQAHTASWGVGGAAALVKDTQGFTFPSAEHVR